MSRGNGRERPASLEEEIRRLQTLLATPIDFDSLIASGVIRAAKGGWYEIVDWRRLPEHARQQLREVKQQTGKPTLVKFHKRRGAK